MRLCVAPAGFPRHLDDQLADLECRRLSPSLGRFHLPPFAGFPNPATKRVGMHDRDQLDQRFAEPGSESDQPAALLSRDRNPHRQLAPQNPVLHLQVGHLPGEFLFPPSQGPPWDETNARAPASPGCRWFPIAAPRVGHTGDRRQETPFAQEGEEELAEKSGCRCNKTARSRINRIVAGARFSGCLRSLASWWLWIWECPRSRFGLMCGLVPRSLALRVDVRSCPPDGLFLLILHNLHHGISRKSVASHCPLTTCGEQYGRRFFYAKHESPDGPAAGTGPRILAPGPVISEY